VKKLVLSLLICVMALGTVGVAFATNMNFPGTPDAVMSQGFHAMPDVDCTGIVFGGDVKTAENFCERWHFDGRRIYADSVWVKFDTELRRYTWIEVAVTKNANHWVQGFDVIGDGQLQLGANLPANTWVEVTLNPSSFLGSGIYFNMDLNAAEYVNVRVIGGTDGTP